MLGVALRLPPLGRSVAQVIIEGPQNKSPTAQGFYENRVRM
jgi:hypothetical protein